MTDYKAGIPLLTLEEGERVIFGLQQMIALFGNIRPGRMVIFDLARSEYRPMGLAFLFPAPRLGDALEGLETRTAIV